MTRQAARILAAAVAIALLVGGVAAVASLGADGPPGGPTAADVAEFYETPSPLPKARPGSLIRSDPIPAPVGAQAWRVLYHSRDLDGNDIAVSGFVVAPEGDAPRGGRPVVAWAHGTTGIADGCAPSRGADPAGGVPWLDELLAAGYVVTATDYEGLGTDGVHPYLVGVSEGRSVLDSIRAARRLPTGASKTAVVYGHSQGGHAALFAGEQAADYAPGLSVAGVAAGAPVAAPGEFIDHTVDRLGQLGFLVMGALGYADVYPDIADLRVLDSVSTERADLAERACAIDVMSAFEGDDPDRVFGVDPGAVVEWERRLRENAAGLQRSEPPVLYWQGRVDDLTPIDSADAYVARACREGTVVDYRVYGAADHVTVLEAAHADVLGFVASVLAGVAPDRCTRTDT